MVMKPSFACFVFFGAAMMVSFLTFSDYLFGAILNNYFDLV